ncbi:hypothetical protein [Hyphomicrobium sp.]|uniref:hypothetical protein n=1 Tax=Hyphomicrobium sp. TaxID=82 RepID=UPI003F71526A
MSTSPPQRALERIPAGAPAGVGAPQQDDQLQEAAERFQTLREIRDGLASNFLNIANERPSAVRDFLSQD